MIDESPNITKLKSRNIFNEIREKVKPITATEEKQDKRVEGQESIEEILSDILRPSQNLCKPPMWCRIEAPHWRFL